MALRRGVGWELLNFKIVFPAVGLRKRSLVRLPNSSLMISVSRKEIDLGSCSIVKYRLYVLGQSLKEFLEEFNCSIPNQKNIIYVTIPDEYVTSVVKKGLIRK